MIPVFDTFIHPDAFSAVSAVLTSGRLSEGECVRQFEDRLSVELGLANPVAVNSGSSALQLALMDAGVGAGDEVVCPAQTFVATALAVLMQGATPVFCDIEYDTGNMSAADLARRLTKKTKAIIPVHWAGYPCDMDAITAIARQAGAVVIEDAAHALGAVYRGRPVGSISDYACFSFQAIKHLTTGDGGAIATPDSPAAERLVARRWFGIDRQRAQPSLLGERQYDLTSLGFKFHMNDYAASLGLANLNGFAARLAERRKRAGRYRQALARMSGLKLFREEEDRLSAYWLFGMHVERRDDFVRALAARGVAASVVHQRIDRNSIFGGLRADLPGQEAFDSSQVNIPVHDAIDAEKEAIVIDAVKAGW